MPKRQPLAKPTMIRMPESMRDELERIATHNGLSLSDVVRFAIRSQLAGARKQAAAAKAFLPTPQDQ